MGLAAVLALAAGCASRPAPAPVVDARGPKPASAKPAVTKQTGDYYVVRQGDTLYSIALENGVAPRDLAQWNGLDDPTRLRVGQSLRLRPSVSNSAVVTAAPEPEKSAVPAPAAYSQFIWPVKGKVLAEFSEPRRKGIDIDGKPGDPIVAAAPGHVTYIGSGIPGMGKLVVIKHDNGFITVYAHNRNILVKEKQAVARGQRIAELGSTDSERPKLHFQIRKGAAAVDPLLYLPR